MTAIAVTVLGWAELSAASMRMGFDAYSQKAGLRQASVYAVVQDVYGQIWVGTEAGLHRFDGYRFRQISAESKATQSQSDWVYSILPMPNGDLLLGTLNRGIVKYARNAGELVSFSGSSSPTSAIRDLAQVAPNEIWAATYGDGVMRISADGDVLGLISLEGVSADAQFVLDLQVASDKRVYAATLGGVVELDAESGVVRPLLDESRSPFRSESGALHLGPDGQLWVGTRFDGVFRLSESGVLLQVVDKIAGRSLQDIRSLTTLSSGVIIAGTGVGLASMSAASGTWEWVIAEGLADDKVMSLLEDGVGGLWVGTKDAGLGYWDQNASLYGVYLPTQLEDATVTSVASIDEQTLAIGTVGAGLRLAKVDGSGSYRTVNLQERTNVMGLLSQGSLARLWIATRSSGLLALDSGLAQHRWFRRGDNPDTLRTDGVMSVAESRTGEIWVGSYRGGLARLRGKELRLQRLNVMPPQQQLNEALPGSLEFDESGALWVGTRGLGLFYISPDDVEAQNEGVTAIPVRSPAQVIYGIAADRRGGVWVASADAGLLHVDTTFTTSTPDVRVIPLSDEQDSYTAFDVVVDDDQSVWLSADFGLGRVSSNQQHILKLQRNHPSSISEYTAGAGALLEDGRVFFGGRRGYNLFDPRDLVSAEASPKLTLTGIETIGDNAKLYPHPEALPALELDHTISVVRFDYALADYAAPEDNRFTFQLEGFDSDWSPLTNRHSSTYTNLDAGDYVFKVRAMNSLGVWSDQVLEVPVRVRPAPWASWWAYTLYAAFFVGLIWLALRWRFREQEREARINQLAYYDQVTGIPNRYLFEARADAALTRAMGAGEAFSVLWLRLVLAPQMSDLLNPEQRDEVARALAARCVRIVHAGFNEPGKRDVARMESLGFAVFVRDQARGEQAQALAERLVNVLGQPLTVAEQLVPIAAHIGLAAAPDDGDKLSDLMTYAQAATFDPGPRQQSRIVRYQASMTQTAAARVSLESRLREALAQSILQVYFQPRLNQDGRITGAEALLRWPVADGPWPSPAEFVPLAEQSELIGVLDRYVLRRVCIAMQRWAKQGIPAIPIAINMSARSLGPDDLVEDLQALCVDHGISADSLEIELTESAVVADMERVRRSLEALQRAGCKISLDDFGTGYSSLSHLQAFAIDCLKIDRSFVAEVDAGGQPASICQGIISLAQGLGMRVVAEGVETQAQWDTLKRMGCPEMQGFLFSPAVPASELAALLVEPVAQPVSQQ
nr:EAL domain-containing protein [Oceanococcus sp. HetDA_MAG_MS8]